MDAQVATPSAALLLFLLPLLFCLVLIVLATILLPEAFLQHNAEVVDNLVPPVKIPTLSSTGVGIFFQSTHTVLLPAPLLFSLFCSESPVLRQRREVVPAVDRKGLESAVGTLREDVVRSIFCNATLFLTFEPKK